MATDFVWYHRTAVDRLMKPNLFGWFYECAASLIRFVKSAVNFWTLLERFWLVARTMSKATPLSINSLKILRMTTTGKRDGVSCCLWKQVLFCFVSVTNWKLVPTRRSVKRTAFWWAAIGNIWNAGSALQFTVKMTLCSRAFVSKFCNLPLDCSKSHKQRQRSDRNFVCWKVINWLV